MKKFVSLLLGAVMSMSLCLPVLSACGETNEDGPHEHTVESWTQTKAPTCTEKGEESGVCTVCGETVTQSIDETGHTIDEKNIVRFGEEATCTEDGYYVVLCPVCNKEVNVTLEALGHDWVNEEINLTEPTCTEKGTVNAKCSRCEETTVRSVPELGHDWETFYTIETAATFDHAGLKYQKCSRCDAKTNETEIPKLNENEPAQYQLRAVRQNGDVIKVAGISYEILDAKGTSVSTGSFRNGVVTLPLLPATYTVRLTSVPKGYTAEESYTVSWEDLVADITLTAKLIMEQPAAGAKYTLGSVMNDFTFRTIQTRSQQTSTLQLSTLLSQYKAVVLNFWDTSCSFCRYEFPGMEAAYKQYQNDIALIAVDDPDGMGGVESENEVRSYVDQMGLTFPVMMDTMGLAEMFTLPGYPTTVVIDCEGAVSYYHGSALVNPRDYEDVAYCTAQFVDLFEKFTSAPYYHA